MRRLVTRSVIAVAAVAGISVWMRQGWVLAGLGSVLAAGLWKFGRCPHPRPLGLLPPTTDAKGTRTPAQWYCGQCGERFPAAFEHDHTPIQRFEGYDETKARNAARRASDLEDRRRQLAVRRAGMAGAARRVEGDHTPASRPSPVPIRGNRLAG
jgi:hypothetical protein